MNSSQSIALALRSIRRRPLFYLNIIALLSLGIGVSIGTFGLLRYILADALPYRDPARLVLIHDVFSRHSNELLGVSVPELTDYRTLARSFSGIAAIATGKSTLLIPQPRRINSASISSNLLPLLGTPPKIGRGFTEEEEEPSAAPVAMVSERLSKDLPDCYTLANCRVTVDGKTYSIIGILPSQFRLPDDLTSAEQTDLFIPLQLRSSQEEIRDNPRLTVIGRLLPSVSLIESEKEMGAIAQSLHLQYPNVYTSDLGYLIRLQDLRAAILGDASFALVMTTIAAAFLFIVALTNAGTFLLIASQRRTHALLTSIALGARMRVLRLQLLVEVLLLSLAAFIPGILLGWLIFLFIAHVSAGRLLPLLKNAHLSPETAIFAVLLSILGTAVMFVISQASLSRARGLLPAINREGRTSSASGSDIKRQTFSLTVQVALSTALIALFLLVALSQRRLQSINLGFQPRNVLVSEVELSRDKFKSNESVLSFFSSSLSDLRSQNGFKYSCLATSPPLVQAKETWPFEAPQSEAAGRAGPQPYAVEVMSGGCLSTLQLPLIDGTDLPVQKDSATAPVALVSKSLAQQLWPSQTAVGRFIRANLLPSSPLIRVVGVVGDLHHEGPNADTAPTVYLHYSDIPTLTTVSVRQMRILSRTERSDRDFNNAVQQTVARIDRSVPVLSVGSLDDLLARVTAPWRFMGQLLSIASLIGPLIAISGLYSLLSALVILRRKEFAIRIAVGASARSLFLLLARHTLLRIAAGGLLGICASLILFSKLKLYLPQTLFSEAVVAAVSGLLALLCVGLLASASLVPAATSQSNSAFREE